MIELFYEYMQILSEAEPIQKKWAAKHPRSLERLITKGGQPNTSPYTKKPSLKRSKSAPPGFGAMGESEVDVIPEIKENLNPKIWNSRSQLDPDVAKRLKQIALDFYEKLELPAEILDITLTGSMANYNWTSKSDLDLHIVINYHAVDDNTELVSDYLREVKSNWNRNHEIILKGHEVEIYVQDSSEPHHSTGVYSISRDKWIIRPARREFEVSEDDVLKKYSQFETQIEMIDSIAKDQKYEEAFGEADRLTSRLRKYRQSGLESGGEFSVENLVFKALRNSEAMKSLYDLKGTAYDQMMSLSESRKQEF